LIGKVFFSHYEPRLRDNEHRASAGQPLRGVPMERRGEWDHRRPISTLIRDAGHRQANVGCGL